MKYWTSFSLMTVLSLLIALGLSQLPRMEKIGEDNREQTVNAGLYDDQLTSSNLVDHLSSLSFYLGIRHVKWDSHVLSVDFRSPAAVDVNGVYRDLYNLCRYTMEQTRNVEELQVRVYADKRSGASVTQQLLISLNLRQDDHILFNDIADGDTNGLKQFLERYCRLTFTDRWRKMLSVH